MRNHRLIDEGVNFLISHQFNQFYIDDIYELININQFGDENSRYLNDIISCLNNQNNNLKYNLKLILYRILNSENGINCINKLICKE